MAARRPLPPLPEPPAPNGQAPTDLTARTAASTSSPAPAHLPLRIRLQILVWTAAARLRPYLLGGAAAILASPHLPHLHLWDRQHLLGPLTLARVVVGAPGYAAVALLAEATRVGLPAYMRRSRRLRAEYDAARRHAETRRRFDRYVDHADRFDPHADYGRVPAASAAELDPPRKGPGRLLGKGKGKGDPADPLLTAASAAKGPARPAITISATAATAATAPAGDFGVGETLRARLERATAAHWPPRREYPTFDDRRFEVDTDGLRRAVFIIPEGITLDLDALTRQYENDFGDRYDVQSVTRDAAGEPVRELLIERLADLPWPAPYPDLDPTDNPGRAPIGLCATTGTTGTREAAFVAADHKHLLIGAGTGAGKALDITTPIPTPDGWTTMEWLRPGDRVFDEHGKPCRVTAATEVMYGHTCYEVEFSDGTVITADAEHLWRTSTWAARRAEARLAERHAQPAEMLQFARDQSHKRVLPSVVTTEEIRATLKRRVGQSSKAYMQSTHAVQVAEPLQYPARSLPIDPYVLGVWLGDGTSRLGHLTTADPEILTHIEDAGYTVTQVSNGSTRQGTARSYSVTPGLQTALRLLGVLGDKHIPRAYLHSATSQRLALLQGLMDTDGTVSRTGACTFAVTNQLLAEQTLELIISLGIKATLTQRPAKFKGRQCGTAYQIHFTTDQPVFRLDRKLVRQKVGHVRPTQRQRYIVDVRPVASVPVRCVAVDSPSRLYLASRACIPTHNSVVLHGFVGWYSRSGQADLVLVDPEEDFAEVWARAPGVIEVAYTLEDAATLLGNVVARMEARKAGTESKDRPIYVIFDEFTKWMGLRKQKDPLAEEENPLRHQVRSAVEEILQRGRKRNVHLIAAVQRPDVDNVPGDVRDQFLARLGGQLRRNGWDMVFGAQPPRKLDTKVAYGLLGPDDEDAALPGRMWWMPAEGVWVEVQCYAPSVEQVLAWGGNLSGLNEWLGQPLPALAGVDAVDAGPSVTAGPLPPPPSSIPPGRPIPQGGPADPRAGGAARPAPSDLPGMPSAGASSEAGEDPAEGAEVLSFLGSEQGPYPDRDTALADRDFPPSGWAP